MADETIHSGDIRILQSERMTDNADGGGRLTGRPVTDGASNDIFDDISDLDRAAGRTSLRKVGAGVLTDNTAQYFGAHAIIDQVPADPNVSVVMFDTGSPSDERAESRDYVESYVTAGATSRMTLLGDQLAGQRSIITFQMPEATLPDLGDVLALMTEQGDAAGEVCFNTAMTGYQEILTDPSYAQQIICFTFPHVGNTGTNPQDEEAASSGAQNAAIGAIFRENITQPASWRAKSHLDDWLVKRGIIGLSGIDTRALTAFIRENGMQNGVIAHNAKGEFDIAALTNKAKAWAGLEGADLCQSRGRAPLL